MNSTINQTVDVYQSKAYRRSQKAYRWECTFEYFVTLAVSGSLLATVLSYIGMSDSMTGIVSSLISLAFLFQLLSVFVVQHIRNTKRFVTLIHTFGQLGFMAIYLIPFLPFAAKYRQILTVVCILLAYFGNYFVTSMIFKWGNSFVDPRRRASFQAGKEMLSLATGIVISWVLGFVMDAFQAADNLEGGFLFSAIAILVFCACDFVTLLLIQSDRKKREAESETAVQEEARASVPMREVIKNTLGNRNFINVVLLAMLWNAANYFTFGFMGTYNIKELAFSVGVVQVITTCGSAARFAASKPLGRFSDKHSFAKGIELGLCMALIAFLCVVFMTPGTRYLLIGFMIFHSMSQAGISGNLNNIIYSYVDSRYFVQASAIKNSVSGLVGFLSSLVASKLLGHIQENGNVCFGIEIYGQQVLAIVSSLLVLITVLFTHKVIGKQKVMLQ